MAVPVDVKVSTISLNGQAVGFRRQGSGEPLLFLHGGRVRARTFKRLIKQLAERHEVVAPDIPGYGDSPTPYKEWSFVDYAAFFDVFLAKLGLNDVTVVGYSMGGGIALNLAAQSKRVKKLVLIDASGLMLSEVKTSHHDMRRLWFYATHPWYASALGVLLRDYVAFLWAHRKDYRQLQHLQSICRQTSHGEAFRSITVPTVIIWGNQDWIYPLAVAHEFQRRIPHSTLHVVPGNHDWPVYNPLLLRQNMI